MEDPKVYQFLGLVVVILASAKLFAMVAQWIGQPAVLGELLAGVALGASVAGLVDPHLDIWHFLSELGVLLLLFEIGLETDLRQLFKVGPASAVVALVGVALPFALGYGVCLLLGLPNQVCIIAGATLTATSVGITARVLTDLNRLQEPESQIILGAAVLDDVVGLVILSLVTVLAKGEEIMLVDVVRLTAIAFGFLAGTLLIGRFVVPHLVRWISRLELAGTLTTLALVFAFGLAWLAYKAGSATIIGAFAAGLLLRETPQCHAFARGAGHVGYFLVPLFFVTVGASVDVSVLNPLEPANYETLKVGGLLIVVAVVGKLLAGYAPFWFHGKKIVIGVGMIPRGEVGLIFAQMGLRHNVFDAGLFSAVTLMVLVTTFLAPPLLKLLFPPRPRTQPAPALEGVQDLVT
jgi:Kef-type K+ transport system membrane component KefB